MPGGISQQSYFCSTDYTGFYQCEAPPFAGSDAFQSCPPGTFCSCEFGMECSANGSPCGSTCMVHSTFGNVAPGPFQGVADNSIFADIVTIPCTISVDSLGMNLGAPPTTGSLQMAIYTNVANNPGTLIVQTPVRNVNGAIGPTTLPLASPIVLPAGSYWVAENSNVGGTLQLTYLNTGNDRGEFGHPFAAGFPPAFGTPITFVGADNMWLNGQCVGAC